MKAIQLVLMIVATWLLAIPVAAQQSADSTGLPPLGLPPVSNPEPVNVPSVGTPSAPPEATSETLPRVDDQDRQADIAALWATFENLRQRDAANTMRRQPASPQTLAGIEEMSTRIASADADFQLADWRAQNLEILARAMGAQTISDLPTGVPPGTGPDIALAVLEAQATLYSQPAPEPDMVIRVLDTRTTMLRVAETGAFTLVWSIDDGFAFVLSQFREVF